MLKTYLPTIIIALLATGAIAYVWLRVQNLRRAEFIRTYTFPPGLLAALGKRNPLYTRKNAALMSRGLRQFFIAYLMSGRKYVAMPSQAADDLWHEFILYTRDYEAFCKIAFGRFLHHTPAAALSPLQLRTNEGLRRVWWYCCKYENIDARRPTRLPLLFALDAKINLPNGYRYAPDCAALRKAGVAGTQCGGDFASSAVDGSTDGFGDGGWSGDSSGGSSGDSSGDSGGCGGGCGGGD